MTPLKPIYPEVLRPNGKAPLLILCDHASNHIPPELGDFPIGPEQLDTHIAYDIGAEAVSRHLSALLDAPCILARVSRLVVDLNRNPKTQDPIPQISDGVILPANQALCPAQRTARMNAYFYPYHDVAEACLDQILANNQRPIVIGLHSFTPEMNGKKRPWDIGFLYHRDPRLFEAMRGLLADQWELCVGDNEPYSGAELYYTMERHGEMRGLIQATVEIRQDLITDPKGQRHWAELFAQCLYRSGLIASDSPTA